MRVKTDKFRTKRVNKRRMTEAQVTRATSKRLKYTLLDYWFDRDEPDQQSVAHHMNRRYP